MLVKKSIAFVGDSFCSAYSKQRYQDHGYPEFQVGTYDFTYTEIIGDAFRYNLLPCGYKGKSWWFSRRQFLNRLEHLEFELETIVFCHTNPVRINNAWNANLITNGASTPENEYYYKHIHDDDFNFWAQQQWFKEISSTWGNIKTIHFHSFHDTVSMSNLLPGVVFTTPLINVSIGELEGTDQDIYKQLFADNRINHFSPRNNQALANIIIHTINNYTPGQYTLDLKAFSLINPNSINFPTPGYGTK